MGSHSVLLGPLLELGLAQSAFSTSSSPSNLPPQTVL